jgi:hypothetical protein
MAGLGAFAKSPIQSGTLILAEAPTLILMQDQHTITEDDITLALHTLAHEQRDAFHALSFPPTHYASDTVRRFMANSMAPTALPGTTCLCLEIARFNHSCVPNSEMAYNPFTHTFDLYAIEEIEQDEEIVWCYIPGSNCMPRSYRQFLQFLNWRFVCRCQACQPETEEGLTSDERRERMYSLRKALEGFELGRLGRGTVEQRGIPIEGTWQPGELEKVLETLWIPPTELPEDLQDLDKDGQAIAYEELILQMAEEGIVGKELALACANLVETSLTIETPTEEVWFGIENPMELAMQYIRVSRPADGPDVRAFEQNYTRWKRTWNSRLTPAMREFVVQLDLLKRQQALMSNH